MGSNTCRSAPCTVRSRTAGMPSGRFSLLPGLVIQARRSGWGHTSLLAVARAAFVALAPMPREMRCGLGIRPRAPALAPHFLEGAAQIGGRLGLVHQGEPDPVAGSLAVSRFNMRSVQTLRSTHPHGSRASPACLEALPPPLSPVAFRRSVPLRIHFPASLRSTVITRFGATMDALTSAGQVLRTLRAMNTVLAPDGPP